MKKEITVKEIINTLDLSEFKENIKNVTHNPAELDEGVKFPSNTYYEIDLVSHDHDLTISFTLLQTGDDDKELYCGIKIDATYDIIEDEDYCMYDLEEFIEDYLNDNY